MYGTGARTVRDGGTYPADFQPYRATMRASISPTFFRVGQAFEARSKIIACLLLTLKFEKHTVKIGAKYENQDCASLKGQKGPLKLSDLVIELHICDRQHAAGNAHKWSFYGNILIVG